MKNEVEKLLNGRGLQQDSKTNNFELNMNYICKDTIKKRKAVYGNNFPKIAALQTEYLGYKVAPKDVAMSLAILKRVRIDFIKSKLQLLKKDVDFDSVFIQLQIKDLNHGLEDSLKDYNNYLWIALNYDEYEKL